MTDSSTSTTAPDDEHTLWVRSDLMADGTYQVGFSYGPDLAWTLPPRAATDRAIALANLALTAEHDAAVLALLTSIDIPISAAARFLHDHLRVPRAARSEWAVQHGPLRIEGGCNLAGKPFITLRGRAGRGLGQISPAELREHAVAILSVNHATALDHALYTALTHHLDLDDSRARGVVAALADHWPPAVWPGTGVPG